MEKKYQVFISSTYTDLIEERQTVVEGILNAGHIPAGMELFHAGDETQKELISEWIEDSDIYVLILGGRYGSLDDDGMGYTHWEYEKAKELCKPIFSLVLTEDYLNKKVTAGKIKATDLTYYDDKLVKFRNEVTSKIVSNIDNIAQIEAEVIKSINRIIKKRGNDLEGWIKGSYLKELEELRKVKENLSEELLSSRSSVIEMQKEISAVKDVFIGEYSFEHVKNKLSEEPIITESVYSKVKKFESSVAEREEKQLNDGDYTIEETNLEKIKKIIEDKLSASQMLIQCKEELLLHSIKLENDFYSNLMNQLYFTKWYEMSLIDKEEVSAQNVTIGSYKHYIPKYEQIKLNERGIKYLQMLEVETNK